jgi:hypothetical protein
VAVVSLDMRLNTQNIKPIKLYKGCTMYVLECEYLLKKREMGKVIAMEAIIKMDEELADFLEEDIKEQQKQSNDWWKDEIKDDPRRKIVKLIRSSIEQKKVKIEDIKRAYNLE